ncbi:MAG: CotH kinase family protein, partial [Muribaculaceae bacterium]|nr:CotH kinase family protein [Muribaculaceae bacterium]
LDDNVSDPALISGGYLVELDNYIDDCTFALNDDSNKNHYPIDGHPGNYYSDLMVTADTPELLSDIQLRFLKDQFTKMNDLVNSSDDSELWSYLELDDAARYYVVEEILSHYEAYHGSTYLMRDHGAGQKWHFSPLWDCGHAFDGPTSNFFPETAQYGNNWIGNNAGKGLRSKAKFMDKVKKTFQWFVNKEADGSASPYERLCVEIDEYVDHVKAAAIRDAERWAGQPLPNQVGADVPQPVVNNSDIDTDKTEVKNFLNSKISWLKDQWGSAKLDEPERDTTPAAELPDYANPDLPHFTYTIYVKDDSANGDVKAWIYDDNSEENHDVFGDSWNGSQVFTPLTAGDGSTYYSLQVILTRELANPKVKIICGDSASASVEFVDGRFYNLNGDKVTDFDPDFVPEPNHIYVINDGNWGTVSMWLYAGSTNYSTQWPGESLEISDKLIVNGVTGVYDFTIPAQFNHGNVIFSNNGNNQYPASGQSGLQLAGKDMVYYTSNHAWSEPVSVDVVTAWSKTLPLVRITTPDAKEIGYGDDGAVKKSTFELDALNLPGVTAIDGTAAGDVTVKGRGKTYWDTFEKKAYKLKFKNKVAVLDMPKSKHWVLMPYANDAANGLLTNYVGHEVSRLIGLEWTPAMQPVEVVINDEYMGLYFIAENVRAAADRVQIADYGDPTYSEEDDFLLEFSSSHVDDGTELFHSWMSDNGFENKLVTATPAKEDIATAEETERIQEYLAGHMDIVSQAISNAKANPVSADWADVIDYEQAAKYYVVQEIMDDMGAFAENFYMHHTTGSKWILGPVWDFSNAFSSNGNKEHLIHENAGFQGSFIKDLYTNRIFMWFTAVTFDKFVNGQATRHNTKARANGIQEDFNPSMAGTLNDVKASIDDMTNKIADAVTADAVRWPEYAATSSENSIINRADEVKRKLAQSQSYLATNTSDGGAGWNNDDIITAVDTIIADSDATDEAEYFDVMGRRVINPQPGSVVIVRRGEHVTKTIVK